MSIFKEISSTVKNIFNADDDVMFENDEEFVENKPQGKPMFSFGKKKAENEGFATKLERPVFDATGHGFTLSQSGQNRAQNRSNGRIQVYVPKSFEEAFNIIKDVRSGFTAMVNVEVANPQVSQRIVDLISGAIYALDGECKKMGEKQYIFSLATETVGAYDYLPVNGVKTQDPNAGFNFNMGEPFNFVGQQQQASGFGQQQFGQASQFGAQQQFGSQQQFGTQPQFNAQPQFNQQPPVPPMSQF